MIITILKNGMVMIIWLVDDGHDYSDDLNYIFSFSLFIMHES